jgi:hypothetical protein
MRFFRRPDGRYYLIAEPHQDLLGDSVIMTLHGSARSHRGGVHTYLASLMTIEALAKTRQRHGYVEVPYDARTDDHANQVATPAAT